MRRRKTRYLTIGGLLLLFGGVVAVYFAQAPSRGGAQVGQPAPDFAVPRLSGGTLVLSDHRGRPVVVNFLATWCGPCWRELPDFADAADKYRDRGVVVIGVAVKDSKEAIDRMVKTLGLTFPIGLDAGGEVAIERYRIRGLPVTVFVDRQGVVRRIWAGPIDCESLEQAIGTIL